jgi:hypothetical protein
MRRLNGWQRIWIVTSLFYAVLVAGTIYMLHPNSWPAADVLRAELTLDLLEQHKSDNEAALSLEERRNLALASARVRRFLADKSGPAADSYDAFVTDVNSSLGVPVNFSPVYIQYEHALNENRQALLRLIGYGFVGWAGPVTFIYLLGAAIAWIREGFRDDPI